MEGRYVFRHAKKHTIYSWVTLLTALGAAFDILAHWALSASGNRPNCSNFTSSKMRCS